MHLVRRTLRDVPDDHGVRGSFAAISTLLGSPVLGAFLIMEAAGIGGMT